MTRDTQSNPPPKPRKHLPIIAGTESIHVSNSASSSSLTHRLHPTNAAACSRRPENADMTAAGHLHASPLSVVHTVTGKTVHCDIHQPIWAIAERLERCSHSLLDILLHSHIP